MDYNLSIIIPIYNVEDYISRCALSIVNQNHKLSDFEVVFVNDGTKDRSIEILKETVDFDSNPNYRIVEKDNGGLSSARNYGIEHSSGNYLWFVDSDDWVEPNSVDLIIKLAETEPDIIYTSQMFKNVGDKEVLKYKTSFNKVSSGIEVLSENPASCAVSYICKRSFIDRHQFRFKEGIFFEDSELTPRMLYHANKVVATDIPLYHHFMRDDSITHNITLQKINDYKIVIETHLNFYRNVVKEEFKAPYANNVSSKIITLLDYSKAIVGIDNKELDKFFIDNKELVEMLCYSNNLPTRYYGLLLRFFPWKATFLFFIVNLIKGRKVDLR